MTETRLYEPARLSTPPAPKFLFSLKPLDATTWLRSMLSKVFPNFYLHKCSHCLCSQACMCSCKSQLCLYNSHFCDNHGFPFRIHRCLSKETKKTRNEYKLSLIMTFISKFYLYKCSHCLGSQACTCSCKSQECWYSWHLCDNHGFHPCIHQFLEGVENIKLQRKHNYILAGTRSEGLGS